MSRIWTGGEEKGTKDDRSGRSEDPNLGRVKNGEVHLGPLMTILSPLKYGKKTRA